MGHPVLPVLLTLENIRKRDTSSKCLPQFQAFSGRDASQAFISYHRRTFPHSGRVAKAALKATDPSVDYTTDDHKDYMELCERVNKVATHDSTTG